jgi:hypothetical protein
MRGGLAGGPHSTHECKRAVTLVLLPLYEPRVMSELDRELEQLGSLSSKARSIELSFEDLVLPEDKVGTVHMLLHSPTNTGLRIDAWP